ncbi:MAG TPA: site-specific integrase [Puia sp.]|jgi:integrase
MGTRKESRKRASKGSVSLQELGATRRFKYRYQGEPKYLTLPPKKTLTALLEKQISKVIELDISMGTHDNTQARYKEMIRQRSTDTTIAPSRTQPLVIPKVVEYIPPSVEQPLIVHIALKEYLKTTGRSLDKDLYHWTLIMVQNWGESVIIDEEEIPVTIDNMPQLLQNMGYSPKTFNNRKLVLNDFCAWMVRKKRIDDNPMQDVPGRRKTDQKISLHRILPDEDVENILNAIRTDKFVHKESHRYNHSHYYPIFLFLAETGVRPAEAIGVQVKKINFKNRIITIDQALARTREGTAAAYRVMKATKMEDSRELPFHKNSSLERMLLVQCKDRDPDELVFLSPNGVACDDRALNETVLEAVLKGLRLEARSIYFFRSCFCSRCFRDGMDIKSVQALSGHKDATVLLNIYAEVMGDKKSIPIRRTTATS